MKIDISEPEKNAAILLSSTTSFVLQQIASLMDELSRQATITTELVKQNQELRDTIKYLEDSVKSEPALQNK